MRKKIILCMILFLIIICIPFKIITYKNGEITEFQALLYKYVSGNSITNDSTILYPKKIFWFPHNFKNIDIYRNDKKINNIPYIEKSPDNAKENKEIRYSNLVDDKTQALIKKLLEKYGISTKNINDYFYYVDYFNGAVHNKGLVKTAFSTYPNKDPYHNIRYGEDLEKKNLDFMGTNCRLSSFFLLKDSIKVNDNNDYTGDVLIFDNSSLENLPKENITLAEKKKFFTIFAGIPSPLVKDKAVHIKNIKEYRTKYGISFPEKEGLSTLEVFTYDDLEQALFIGHIGVLLQYNDEYIFIEKLSFDLPYQAVIFQTKQQIYDYLIKKYGKYTSEQAPEVFIMENDQEFKTE